jgi:hypothetical protein
MKAVPVKFQNMIMPRIIEIVPSRARNHRQGRVHVQVRHLRTWRNEHDLIYQSAPPKSSM